VEVPAAATRAEVALICHFTQPGVQNAPLERTIEIRRP